MDRYIRDLTATIPRRHYLWHVGSGLDVIEDTVAGRYFPLAESTDGAQLEAALGRWVRAAGVGMVHLHSVAEPCRKRLVLLERVAPTPWIATLHDLMFINPDAFGAPGVPEPNAAWLAGVFVTLSQAAAVIVPSQFIRDLALSHLPGIDTRVIAPGLDASRPSPAVTAPAEFEAQRPRHLVAVVGAIGPHKGSALLDSLVARLEGSEIGLVVVGYTDTEITRGWRVPGRYYVYGPYLDQELNGVLEAFGVDVALFPNRLPESFSYTLSEVWRAGIPAVVPDEGALGERVARWGGGWRLPPAYTAAGAADFLQELFSRGRAEERARVKSEVDPHDSARIPSLVAMSEEIKALYERFGLPEPHNGTDARAAKKALEPLLAANLDGFAFRKELIRLAGEVVELKAAVAQARPWAKQLERDIAEAQAWARKLEHDVDVLTAEARSQFEENRRLADDKAAFDQLPLLVRKLLLKKVFRARR